MKSFIVIFLALTTLASCKVKPVEIDFGHENCAWCQMTIVDSRFACELVSDKGKAYKFDAIECLAQFYLKNTETNWQYIVFMPFDQPGSFHNESEVVFVQSNSIKSPMGGGLAAYLDVEQTDNKEQTIYDWPDLLKVVMNFINKPE